MSNSDEDSGLFFWTNWITEAVGLLPLIIVGAILISVVKSIIEIVMAIKARF